MSESKGDRDEKTDCSAGVSDYSSAKKLAIYFQFHF